MPPFETPVDTNNDSSKNLNQGADNPAVTLWSGDSIDALRPPAFSTDGLQPMTVVDRDQVIAGTGTDALPGVSNQAVFSPQMQNAYNLARMQETQNDSYQFGHAATQFNIPTTAPDASTTKQSSDTANTATVSDKPVVQTPQDNTGTDTDGSQPNTNRTNVDANGNPVNNGNGNGNGNGNRNGYGGNSSGGLGGGMFGGGLGRLLGLGAGIGLMSMMFRGGGIGGGAFGGLMAMGLIGSMLGRGMGGGGLGYGGMGGGMGMGGIGYGMGMPFGFGMNPMMGLGMGMYGLFSLLGRR